VYERPPSTVRPAETQIYDVVIKHAQLGQDETDLALIGGRIARVGRRIPAAHARLVIEAEGYVVAGACGNDAGPDAMPVEGGSADLALIESSDQERRCILGIRGGRVVFDRMGLSIPDVSRAGPYSNFK
jgi:hypothetical protein